MLGCWGCLESKGHRRVLAAIPIFPAVGWDCLSRRWEQQWGQHRTLPGSHTLLGTFTLTSCSLPQLSQTGLNVSTGHQDRPNTLDPLAVHFPHSSLTPSSHCLHCVACDTCMYAGGREGEHLQTIPKKETLRGGELCPQSSLSQTGHPGTLLPSRITSCDTA